MNVLFYIAPVTEIAEPLHKVCCYEILAPRLLDAMAAAGFSCDCTFLISEDVEEAIRRKGLPEYGALYSFSQKELLDNYTVNANQEASEWQETGATTPWGSYLCGVIRRRLPAGYIPDVIVAFSVALFLKEIYPSALFLYHEYAAFSRPPYPETFTFDPCGKGLRFLPSLCAGRMNGIPIATRSRELLAEYRDNVLTALKGNGYVDDFFAGLRKKYKRLFILALGYENYFENTAFSSYQSQFELVEHVMDSVDSETGVLVTQHPFFAFVRRKALDELKMRYSNLISEDLFYDIPCFSQNALAYCDGAITQSSTVGIQAAFLNKYFLSVGRYHVGIADCTDLSRFGEMLERPPMDRAPFFIWNLTHYAIARSDMAEYLKTCLPELRKLASLSPDEMFERYPVFIPEVELAERFFKPANEFCRSGIRLSGTASIELFYFRKDGTYEVPPEIHAFMTQTDGFFCYDFALSREHVRRVRLDFGREHEPLLFRKFQLMDKQGEITDLIRSPLLGLVNVATAEKDGKRYFMPENNDPQFIIFPTPRSIKRIVVEYKSPINEKEFRALELDELRMLAEQRLARIQELTGELERSREEKTSLAVNCQTGAQALTEVAAASAGTGLFGTLCHVGKKLLSLCSKVGHRVAKKIFQR